MQDPSTHQAGELGARLRALRAQHPTLAVLTEIIERDERRIIFSATVLIDGAPRARGHAAQRADPAGVGVAVAERLAVEQALLLGGFDTPADEAQMTDTTAPASAPTPAPLRQVAPVEVVTVLADQGVATPRRGRSRVARPAAALDNMVVSATDASTETSPVPEASSAPPPRALDADATSTVASSSDDPVTGAIPVNQAPLPSSPLADMSVPVPPVVATDELPTPSGEEIAPVARPRRPRDRQAERERARARRAATTPEATSADDTALDDASAISDAVVATAPDAERSPAPEPPPALAVAAPEASRAPAAASPGVAPRSRALPVPPEATPRPAPRQPRPRTTAPARQVTPEPEAPPAPETQEALRAAWQAGRPIPVWWPPDRVADARRLTRAGAEQLREAAVAEEITPGQLDTYSTLLFGVAVAGLTRAQGAILAERLHPAYPSPLEELRARRVLHPLAVGDAFPIPPDRQGFIYWRDVPPVEEPPTMPAPPVPTWRTRAVPGGGRRGRSR